MAINTSGVFESTISESTVSESTMSGDAELIINSLAADAGVKVFDLEYPRSGVGTLRVFICNLDGSTSGVGIEQCTRLGKRLSDSDELDAALPGDFMIEVSTPGVNRKLRRTEHFAGAVGERVKLGVESSRKELVEALNKAKASAPAQDAEPVSAGKVVLKGRLVSFDGQALNLEVDGEKQALTVLLSEVRDARVDFAF